MCIFFSPYTGFKPKFRLLRYFQWKMAKILKKRTYFLHRWAAGGFWRHGRMLVGGLAQKRSVPLTKKLSFQNQHGVIHEPSLICVFTISHPYCFLTLWIRCCYASEFLEQFNRRESWSETPHFYRSSRSSITHTHNYKHEMLNVKWKFRLPTWAQTVDVSHPSSTFNSCIKRYFIFSWGLTLFLAVVFCSPLFFTSQSDLEI